MDINTYARKAKRTQNPKLSKAETALHALFGIASEVGEIHSIFQHYFQGEEVNRDKLQEELGDLMWFIVEFCDMYGIDPSNMLKENIEKLKKRYPEGFLEENSTKRHESVE